MASLVSLPFTEICYKRWLTSDTALIFVHSKETRCYKVVKYDGQADTYSDWSPGENYPPQARVLPVKSFGTNGELLSSSEIIIRPRLHVSPDRGRICWIDTDENWIIIDVGLQAVERIVRSRDFRHSEQFIWFADNQTWAAPITSRSYDKFVNLEIHSIEDASVKRRPMHGIGSGTCVGTTDDNRLLIVSSIPKSTHRYDCWGNRIHKPRLDLVQIASVDLNGSVCRGTRVTVRLPRGYSYTETVLSRDNSRLAWLMTRLDTAGAESSLWISDIDGKNMKLIGELNQQTFPELTEETRTQDTPFYDLEWIKDQNSVSFIAGLSICRVDL